MKISNFPISVRMAAAVLIPCIGMVAFGAIYILTKFETAARMEKVQVIATFSEDLGDLVHQLQRERGRSAQFLGAGGADWAKENLVKQRDVTDRSLEIYLKDAEHLFDKIEDEALHKAVNDARLNLAAIKDVRKPIDTAQIKLKDAVGPYTKTIVSLLHIISEATHTISVANTSETLVALQGLMFAKEKAGIERAVGSNALASGHITPESHRAVVELGARQDAFLEEFRELMGPEWGAKVDALNKAEASIRYTKARDQLISSVYSRGQPSTMSSQWFNLTTARIELLMDLERELSQTIHQIALDQQRKVWNEAIAILLISILAILTSCGLSLYLVSSVVRPIKRVTDYLTRLSQGESGLQIKGTDREDEIGVLSRAAVAFMHAMDEKTLAQRRQAESEQEALVQRREVLATMATEVKNATVQSVNGIADTAEALKASSETMRDALAQAGESAEQVTTSTTETIERSERAADLASQLSTAIGEVTEQISLGDTIAREAVERAASSQDNVTELQQAAVQINDFVELISGLADQTNLLALNATIEAARAGDAGKGFAVVASEVKALAGQTNKSATEIAQRVSQIQQRTQSAVDSIADIAQSIDQIGEVTAAVAGAMEEQRASTGSFAVFIDENRTALSQVGTDISNLAAIAIQSAQEASEMSGQVEEMSQKSRQASVAIPEIVERAVQAADRREHGRSNSTATAELTSNGQTKPAKLVEVSEGGFRIEGTIEGNPDQVKVRMPNSSKEASADVVWSANNQTGMQFDRAG